MVLTILTNDTLVVGGRKFKVLRVVFSGIYAAGGIELDGDDVGLDRIGNVQVSSARSDDGYEQVTWVKSSSSIQWHSPTTGNEEAGGALPDNFTMTLLVEDAD